MSNYYGPMPYNVSSRQKSMVKSKRNDQYWHQEWQQLHDSHSPQLEYAPMNEIDFATWPKLGGSSSFGKYTANDVPFCGAAGGAMLNTFPVYDPGHARAALSYSRNAPDELGVRECVQKVRQLPGWPEKYANAIPHKQPRVRPYKPRGPRGPAPATSLSRRKAQYPGVGGIGRSSRSRIDE